MQTLIEATENTLHSITLTVPFQGYYNTVFVLVSKLEPFPFYAKALIFTLRIRVMHNGVSSTNRGLPGGQRCCTAHREDKLISPVDIAREASGLTHSRVYLMNQCRNKGKRHIFPILSVKYWAESVPLVLYLNESLWSPSRH